jgi:uncharacterized protein YndB with AHSA1/START domain/biotin operon repressor
MDSEQVFKALADPNRRAMLDSLFNRDGQSLNELAAPIDMTRFGVMKHLQVLTDAGLIVTRKVGREKLHYLNPVPIQQVYERWVSKYAQPFTYSLLDLQAKLEQEPEMSDKPNHVYEVYIRTSPEKLWQALTDGKMTEQYYFGTAVKSDLKVGSPFQYFYGNGNGMMLDGEILEIDPPTKLVTSFRPVWVEGPEGQRLSRVEFEITQMGDSCKLLLSHYGLNPEAGLTMGIGSGWAQILSGLKTLLETGSPLVVTAPEEETA